MPTAHTHTLTHTPSLAHTLHFSAHSVLDARRHAAERARRHHGRIPRVISQHTHTHTRTHTRTYTNTHAHTNTHTHTHAHTHSNVSLAAIYNSAYRSEQIFDKVSKFTALN